MLPTLAWLKPSMLTSPALREQGKRDGGACYLPPSLISPRLFLFVREGVQPPVPSAMHAQSQAFRVVGFPVMK